jgi:long-chain fatty acid transport protein
MVLIPPVEGLAVGSGGFENASFSGRSLGEANSVVAQADEPAAVSYNPAGIVDLKGLQVQSNVAFVSLFTFQEKDGGSTRSSGTLNFVPTAYATVNPGKYLWNRVGFGIGTDSPFGLAPKYDSNHSIAHYTGYKTWLKMFTIKPVVAVKLADWVSVGGGPMYYRVFDFGTILAYPNRLLQSPFGPVPGPPLLPLFPDGQLRLNFSGNSWGWQMGVLVKPHKKHRFGFYFRSPVQMKLKGLIKVENASDVAVVPLTFPPFVSFRTSHSRSFETGGHTKLSLPLNITVGYAFKPSDRTTVEVDFGFTRWATFKRLYINADPVTAADDAILRALGPIDMDWRNSFALHLGGNHRITKKLTLRGGSFYYWTPVPKTHFRPSVPDANSMGVTIGASYDLWKYVVVDFAYHSRFWFRRHIDNEISEPLGTSVDGRYSSYGQEFFIGLTYKWESLFQEKDMAGTLAPIAIEGSQPVSN